MAIQDSIQTFAKHARYELTGAMTFEAAGLTVKEIVESCRERKITKLLINAYAVQGMQPPSMGERFWFAAEVAKSAMGQVRIALVARAEFIDPNKFGVIVAANRNLVVDIFTDEAEALKWLLS